MASLREFVALKGLGHDEWGEPAEILLKEMQKKMEEEAAEDQAMFESESWCTNPFGEGAAVVGACACMSPVIFGMVFNWSDIFG
jgi:hypothetical protein